MANTDWPNKSLKIEREEEKTAAYQEGKEAGANEALQIGEGIQARLTSKQKREAFDKFVIDWRKQNSLEGTDVMPPNEVVPLWMRRAEGKNEGMTIAGGPYRMNKEGNAEVWKFGGPNYHYNPMPKSYYDLIKSVKGMNFKKADAAAGTKIINELPRGGWPSRNSHRGLVDKDTLLDTMRRATAAFQAQYVRGDLNFHPRRG